MSSSFEIGLSGLDAARRGLDTIGNNVANAATEGYHKQRLEMSPARSQQFGYLSFGTGVDVNQVSRTMDSLLETEIMRQVSQVEAVGQELSALQTAEVNFGEFGGGEALNTGINKFFETLRDLVAHPTELTWQYQFVTTANNLASQFRTLGASLSDLADRVLREAQTLASEVNELATEIAALNASLEKIEIGGSPANNLRDQRDQKIAEMAKLIDVDTIARDFGVVDVTAAGIPVVIGSQTTEIEVSLVTTTTMGVSAVGSPNPATSGVEGKIGGLIDFKNSLLPSLSTQLDTLAKAIADQINQYHVQGVGSSGSFDSLTGRELGAATSSLSDLSSDISTGAIQIRVTDSSGNITRTTVTIADTSDTLQSVIDDITAITGLTASVVNNKVQIAADTGYSFDFIPAPLPSPTSTSFNGTTDPTVAVAGHYTGTSNKTFTFTVTGTGEIGNDSSLTLTANDGTTDVKTFNIGTGYVVGDKLDLGNGIKITLTTGDLADGDTFVVPAFADTDTTGFLATAGLNTFFSGSNAQSLAVETRIQNDPTLVATSLDASFAGNQNADRMADLMDSTVTALGGRTISDYYQTIVTNLGQDISIKESRKINLESVMQNLTTRRTEISGVDINEEAAQILLFEQMYQAMAKYMNTVNQAIQTLMDAM